LGSTGAALVGGTDRIVDLQGERRGKAMLTAEQFVTRVALEFELEEPLDMTTDLTRELGFDSLDLFDLVLFVEELSEGSMAKANDFPVLSTLSDAYLYLTELEPAVVESN
jgi:acyl carrier protein